MTKIKINRLVRKYYVDIFFLIILFVIFLGGMTAKSNASADTTNPGISAAVKTDLMKSLRMSEAINPELSPDFTLTALNGDKVQLSQMRGNVVLLSFWATW